MLESRYDAIIAKPTVAAVHVVEKVVERAVETVTRRHHDRHPEPPPTQDGAADQEFGIRTQDPPPDKRAPEKSGS